MPEVEVDLLEHAKTITRSNVEELKGPEDDIVPIFFWMGRYGGGLMPLIPMTDWRQKDRLAAAMQAALVVARAEEAVFISTSWMVKAKDPYPDAAGPGGREDLLGGLPPSQHPDRIECIVLIYQNYAGHGCFTSAELVRYPDKPPTMKPWDDKMHNAKAGGRFGEAIEHGLTMANEMPEEMAEIIEAAWHEGQQEDLMRRFLKVYGQITGVTGVGVSAMPVVDLPESTITAREVADRYGIPLRHVYEVCKSGYLPARREKGRWRIDEMDAAEWAFGYQLRKQEMEDDQ